ncbi:hypothetical protein PPTG_02218 [Phytophthora nicotianae INRA-310]|uniref:Uncharacterized protein n=1 Tax=Phytophthora nicotianae (strain INRA-310) TaxID=761204 RepID=W2RCE7_PHYN3|nr:hypothetical protein PPTG_02218 [Phytophthora nicotianae INRA-310]ETN22215.1 hypothetical protein PPTG_02218 [Phytophthora nicotianae INRA-310]
MSIVSAIVVLHFSATDHLEQSLSLNISLAKQRHAEATSTLDGSTSVLPVAKTIMQVTTRKCQCSALGQCGWACSPPVRFNLFVLQLVDMFVTDSVDGIVSSGVTAEDVLSVIDAVQGSAELNILVSDVVVTSAESLDGVVVATDVVAVTEVIALSGEDLPIAVSVLDADAATKQDLLNRLRKSTVSKACFAYYALTETSFASR